MSDESLPPLEPPKWLRELLARVDDVLERQKELGDQLHRGANKNASASLHFDTNFEILRQDILGVRACVDRVERRFGIQERRLDNLELRVSRLESRDEPDTMPPQTEEP